MRRLAIVSVVMVAALSAGLAACGQEELDPREESLARGSALLIARGVVPRIQLALPIPDPNGDPMAPDQQPDGTGSTGSGSVNMDFGFGDILGGSGDGSTGGGIGGPSVSGGVGGPSVGTGGVAGAPLSGGAGGVAGGPSTGIGGVAGGPGAISGGAFGSALASSLCGFLEALCDFIVGCVPEASAGAGQCQVFSTGQCPALIDEALTRAGGDVPAIPPGAVQAIDCFTNALKSASCSGEGFEALEGVGAALQSCDTSALQGFGG